MTSEAQIRTNRENAQRVRCRSGGLTIPIPDQSLAGGDLCGAAALRGGSRVGGGSDDFARAHRGRGRVPIGAEPAG